MQFEAVLPDQRTRTAVRGYVQRQDQGGTPAPHGQHDPPALPAHGLRRPADRVKAFPLVGILHAHLGMAGAELAGGLDIGKKGMHHHLHGLTVQGKASFGGLSQVVLPRPLAAGPSCLQVQGATMVPHLGGFPLCCCEAAKERWRQAGEAIDFDRGHGSLFFL